MIRRHLILFVCLFFATLARAGAPSDVVYTTTTGPITRGELGVADEIPLSNPKLRAAVEPKARAEVIARWYAARFQELGLKFTPEEEQSISSSTDRDVASRYLFDHIYSKAKPAPSDVDALVKKHKDEFKDSPNPAREVYRVYIQPQIAKRTDELEKEFNDALGKRYRVDISVIMAADRLEYILRAAREDGYADRADIRAGEDSRRSAIATQVRGRDGLAIEDEFTTPTLSAMHEFFDANPVYFDTPETRDIVEIITQRGADAATKIAEGFRALQTTKERNDYAEKIKKEEAPMVRRLFQDRTPANFSGYGKAALDLPEGGVLDPIETEAGYSVLVVITVRPGSTAEFDASQERIYNVMRAEFVAKRFTDMEEAAVEAAKMTWAGK